MSPAETFALVSATVFAVTSFWSFWGRYLKTERELAAMRARLTEHLLSPPQSGTTLSLERVIRSAMPAGVEVQVRRCPDLGPGQVVIQVPGRESEGDTQ